MARNLTSSYRPKTVDVICTDNDKKVKATLITSKPDLIVVELDGGLRLTLYKNLNHTGLYVGNSSGLEFQCRPNQ